MGLDVEHHEIKLKFHIGSMLPDSLASSDNPNPQKLNEIHQASTKRVHHGAAPRSAPPPLNGVPISDHRPPSCGGNRKLIDWTGGFQADVLRASWEKISRSERTVWC